MLNAQRATKVNAENAAREQYENSIKAQYENGEITEAQYKTLVSTETQKANYIPPIPSEADNPFDAAFVEDDDLGVELSDKEKQELAIK